MDGLLRPSERYLDGLLRPSERYWALEELCQCYPCGLAPFNNRSLDLRRQKGQANEPAPIWRIRRCDEHGQSGIILVQHGVCGAERLDQNEVWPVSRTWALENPGLATTLDQGQMQPGETRIHRIRLEAFVGLEALAHRGDPVDRQQAVQRLIVELGADHKRDGIVRTSRDHATQRGREGDFERRCGRGLVKCGHCGVGVSCHKMRGRNGTFHRYYYCHNHDPLRAGGEHRRCPERNIRAGELDTFVFKQVRSTLLRPDVLLAGEHAVSARREPVADELLQAQLAKLQRKIAAAAAERRRLADLYQSALIDRDDLLRRSKELQDRTRSVEHQCGALTAQRKELAQQNALRERIAGFSAPHLFVRTTGEIDLDIFMIVIRLIMK